MDRETLEALPIGSTFTVGSACPSCATRDVVEVTVKLIAKKLGTFSLAGAQMKFPASRGYVFTCTNCGATGPAGPKEES